MRVLGAILCGGRSTRFGADKALALLDAVPLIEHVRRSLAVQSDDLVCCGRPHLGLEALSDRPRPDFGPLGALNAALHAAAGRGFDAVLSVPCDVPDLPTDLRTRLEPAPSYAAELPVIGLWPASLAPLLDVHVATDSKRSLRGWAERVGARTVSIGRVTNINRVEDLRALG